MKNVIGGLLVAVSLSAFSIDGMIDSISDKVSDAVGNKVSQSIENYGSESSETKVEHKEKSVDKLEKLKELVKMRDAGYLTKEEFVAAKKELLQ